MNNEIITKKELSYVEALAYAYCALQIMKIILKTIEEMQNNPNEQGEEVKPIECSS